MGVLNLYNCFQKFIWNLLNVINFNCSFSFFLHLRIVLLILCNFYFNRLTHTLFCTSLLYFICISFPFNLSLFIDFIQLCQAFPFNFNCHISFFSYNIFPIFLLSSVSIPCYYFCFHLLFSLLFYLIFSLFFYLISFLFFYLISFTFWALSSFISFECVFYIWRAW